MTGGNNNFVSVDEANDPNSEELEIHKGAGMYHYLLTRQVSKAIKIGFFCEIINLYAIFLFTSQK